MADTRVDVVLALKTLLAGNAEGLAYLNQFEQQGKKAAHGVSNEWDHLQHKLERKFSLPDIAYDLLKGFGAGSAFALIETTVDHFFKDFEEREKAAAENTKAFNETLNQLTESV